MKIVTGMCRLPQGNELNALAGLVSLCPAVTGDVFKIEGGNSRLSEVRPCTRTTYLPISRLKRLSVLSTIFLCLEDDNTEDFEGRFSRQKVFLGNTNRVYSSGQADARC